MAPSMDIDKPSSSDSGKKPKKIAAVTPSASAETASLHPDMALAHSIHQLVLTSSGKLTAQAAKEAGVQPAEKLNQYVMMRVGGDGKDKADSSSGDGDGEEKKESDSDEAVLENPSLYRQLRSQLKFSWTSLSDADLDAMDARHAITASNLEAAVEKAREDSGDMEVLDARLACARFAARCLSKEEALGAYQKVVDLPKMSAGKSIDALLETARVASFYGDTKKCSEVLEKAAKFVADGGDWDRRNRLKVYKAISSFLVRDVKSASKLLVDCIATFSCNELCTYKEFVVYATLSNLLYLPRTELKKKIIDGSEILQVADEIPVVIRLVNALYDCDYRAYLQAIVDLQPILLADRFLQPHSGYLVRELHVLGYRQFLDSYQSVTLASMASSFGVGAEFLDLQLSRFIAAGRLTAKIDKFGGVVETNRPDLKNAQYRDMIREGDLLLNRIQKLGRVVDL